MDYYYDRRCIYKYPLEDKLRSGLHTIKLPVGAQMLYAVMHREWPVLYVLEDPEQTSEEDRAILIEETGRKFVLSNSCGNLRSLGQISEDASTEDGYRDRTFHVFAVNEAPAQLPAKTELQVPF